MYDPGESVMGEGVGVRADNSPLRSGCLSPFCRTRGGDGRTEAQDPQGRSPNTRTHIEPYVDVHTDTRTSTHGRPCIRTEKRRSHTHGEHTDLSDTGLDLVSGTLHTTPEQLMAFRVPHSPSQRVGEAWVVPTPSLSTTTRPWTDQSLLGKVRYSSCDTGCPVWDPWEPPATSNRLTSCTGSH